MLCDDTENRLVALEKYQKSVSDADNAINEVANQPKDSGKEVVLQKLSLVKGPIEEKLTRAKNSASDLNTVFDGCTEELTRQQMAALVDRAENLKKELTEELTHLDYNEAKMQDFCKQISDLKKESSRLSTDFEELGQPARDLESLNSQLVKIEDFLNDVGKERSNLDKLRCDLDGFEHFGNLSEKESARSEIDSLNSSLDSLADRGRDRRSEIGSLRENLQELLSDIDQTRGEVEELMVSPVLQQAVSSDIAELRQQQNDMKAFKTSLQPLSDRVEKLKGYGNELVKTASPGTDVSKLELEVDKLGSTWNELKMRMAGKEQKLDASLMGLGNYKDALNALVGWLEDTEDVVNSQKHPSQDYKVVRAQLQEQKLLLKMIDDKRPSVDSVLSSAEQVRSLTDDPHEQNQLHNETEDVANRYSLNIVLCL